MTTTTHGTTHIPLLLFPGTTKKIRTPTRSAGFGSAHLARCCVLGDAASHAGGRQGAACCSGGRTHISVLRFDCGWKFRSETCRLCPWRQVTRVTWGTCRHGTLDNPFGTWSFLTIHSTKWSILSKIPLHEPNSLSSRRTQTPPLFFLRFPPLFFAHSPQRSCHPPPVAPLAFVPPPPPAFPCPMPRRRCRRGGTPIPSTHSNTIHWRPQPLPLDDTRIC